MNPAQLLAHFERISDAPDAIPRLRRFILDLAVRGKLVEQDPKEEPATELLKRIEAEKKRLGKERKLRGDTTLQPYDADGQPFVIPRLWVWVPFGEIMISRDGERIPVSQEERNGRAKTYDYYGASGVIDKIDEFLFDKPLLLIGEDGANLINRSTPIAFIARGKYWVNNHAHVLDGISEEFLRYVELYINAIDLKPYVTGTAQPKMNQAKMNSIPTALPPLAEQSRIVAKVDELMALCDRLESAQAERETRRDRLAATSLNRLNQPAEDAAAFRDHARFHLQHLPRLTIRPEDVKPLRQTILNLAVRGKLVEQDPKDEPADALAVQARRTRREIWEASRPETRRKTNYITPRSASREPAFQLPIGWTWVGWREVGTCQNGRAFPSTEYSNEGVRLLRPGNLFADGTVVWTSNTTRDLPESWAEKFPEFLIGESEIVMNLTAQSLKDAFLGRACLTGFGERCLLNQRIARLISYATMPRFTLWLLKSGAFRSYVDAGLNQGSLIEHMFTKQIDEFEFALPPLAEQRRIVAKVDELMALCDRLEAQLTTTPTESRRLLEAVLHEALAPVG